MKFIPKQGFDLPCNLFSVRHPLMILSIVISSVGYDTFKLYHDTDTDTFSEKYHDTDA